MTTGDDVPGPDSAPSALLSPAEFRCVREWLGLTPLWMADHLGVAESAVHRWEAGVSSLPVGAASELLRLAETTHDALDDMIDSVKDLHNPTIVTYRTDTSYREHFPEQDWPASWHRALCARLAAETPVRIEYA